MRKQALLLAPTLALAGCVMNPTVYEPQADREGIRGVVGKRLPELQECYEKAIEERPGAEGKIVLEWEINHEGKVAELRLKKADPKITGATDCTMKKVQTWIFPAPANEETVLVTYPFIFSENRVPVR